MKKVVYLCPNGYIGGAEKFVLESASGHLKFGSWRPTIIFFNNGPGVEEAKRRAIPHFVLKSKFRLSRPLSLLRAVLELRHLFKREKFDLYNATMPYAHIVGALASLDLDLKRTWYQHGPVGGLLDTVATFFSVDQIYFNSEYTRTEHFRHPIHTHALVAEKIIPIGIPEQDTHEARDLREQHVSPHGTLILTGGRITASKGFENAIIAFNKVTQLNPDKELKLLIAGEAPEEEDQRYLSELQKLAKDEIKSGHVEFLGRKENLSSYMKAADIFLHTTKIPEAFGLVIAEAMKQDTLVIGTSEGGSGDILIDGKTGLSFDSTSDKAAAHLTRLLHLALHSDHSALVRQAKELIDKQFSLQEMTSRLEEQFNFIISI